MSSNVSRQQKGVILRLRVSNFTGRDFAQYHEAINVYLLYAGLPSDEAEVCKHYAHIETFQAPELNQTSFHIILDMEKDLDEHPTLEELPHEIYHVRRDGEGNLQVNCIQNPLEEKNFLMKMRTYTDKLYAWGK